jgi:hypothetical protein
MTVKYLWIAENADGKNAQKYAVDDKGQAMLIALMEGRGVWFNYIEGERIPSEWFPYLEFMEMLEGD